MAPKVQTLAEVTAQMDPAFAGAKDVIAKKQALLPGQFDALRAGINAARGQGFNAINNSATGRGASFSGIPIDEQATYLSTKYLPGMMQTNTDQNAADLELAAKLADINKEQATSAMSKVASQEANLNAWNMQQAQIAATAAEGARNRAASAAASARDVVSPDEAAITYLDNMRGSDGYVSPTSFRNAQRLYIQAGGDNKSFMDKYWSYTGTGNGQANQSNWKSYYYGS